MPEKKEVVEVHVDLKEFTTALENMLHEDSATVGLADNQKGPGPFMADSSYAAPRQDFGKNDHSEEILQQLNVISQQISTITDSIRQIEDKFGENLEGVTVL